MATEQTLPAAVPAGPPGAPAVLTTEPTLGAALLRWAADHGDQPAFHVYRVEGTYREVTVAELAALAGGAAQRLSSAGVGPGDVVAVSMDTGLGLLATLFGGFLLGAVPMLLEPPLAEGRMRVWRERVGHALERCRPRLLVTDAVLGDYAAPVAAATGVPLSTPDPSTTELSTADPPVPPRDPDAVALLQLTSGTLGAPRAAVFTHRALYANARAIGARVPYQVGDVMVSWLPLHHDMGLAGATLSTFLHRIPVVLLPPAAFLMRPQHWLWAMHRFRGTLSPAPNFAYQRCAGKVRSEDLRGLDLRCWRAAFNGAEMVSADTLRLWQRRLGPAGFRAESMRPAYGMAEVGVALAMPEPGRAPRVEYVDGHRLAATGEAVPVAPEHARARPLVGLGTPLDGYRIEILDADGSPVPPRVEGRIFARGPSLMSGYLDDPQATAATVHGGRLDTGDLGFWADGELFVTGRVKDLLIVAGRNLAPYPAEAAVSGVPGVRPGGVAVIGVPEPASGTEAVVVVVESAVRSGGADHRRLVDAVSRAAGEQLGASVDRVVVVRPGGLPRTPSGKLQRGRIAAELATGEDAAVPAFARARAR